MFIEILIYAIMAYVSLPLINLPYFIINYLIPLAISIVGLVYCNQGNVRIGNAVWAIHSNTLWAILAKLQKDTIYIQKN